MEDSRGNEDVALPPSETSQTDFDRGSTTIVTTPCYTFPHLSGGRELSSSLQEFSIQQSPSRSPPLQQRTQSLTGSVLDIAPSDRSEPSPRQEPCLHRTKIRTSTVPIVSGKDWTSEVIRIANTIGHALAPDRKDSGIPGQFHACHAEKQLIAYFISKHVFLETETRAPKKVFEYLDTYYCTQGELEEAILRGEYKEGGTLHELAAKAPPALLKQANIFVSSPPCSDCVCFTDVVNAKLSLRITVQNHSTPR